jgi:hypothetical protein
MGWAFEGPSSKMKEEREEYLLQLEGGLIPRKPRIVATFLFRSFCLS